MKEDNQDDITQKISPEAGTQYNITIDRLPDKKNIFSYSLNKKTLIFFSIGAIIVLFGLFLLICAITPIKMVLPGYPTEKEKRESIRDKIKLDSLDNEIKLWKRELENIQLITTGHEPKAIKSDSLKIEEEAQRDAESWKKNEMEVREFVESQKDK